MLNTRALILLGIAALAWPFGAYSQTSSAPAPHFAVQTPSVAVLTEQDMQTFGLLYPDGMMGVVRAANGSLSVFASGGSFGRFGPGKNIVPDGTYKFAGTLDHIAPAKTNGRWPVPSLTDGERQPSPDGSDFDRDYAGGGPTYLVRDPRSPNAPLLLQVYHGEYQPTRKGFPFYGASGLAISRDDGDTFAKIGEILSPHVSRDEFFGNQQSLGISANASLVEADANGNPVAPTAGLAGVYVYAVFSDLEDFPLRAGLAVARVAKTDLLDAIAKRTVPHFKKFVAASAAPGGVAGNFDEPGRGGKSTLVVREQGYLALPSVAYDTALRKFVLCYMRGQKELVLRTADNLLRWSEPATIVSIPASSDLKVFYPSLVGTGPDPAVLGTTFDVFYLQRAMPGNRDVGFQRVAVTAMR